MSAPATTTCTPATGAETCQHINMVRMPTGYQVFKEECTQCYDNDTSATGLDLCLTCFNGGCTADKKHAARHHAVSSHPIVLNIRKREIEKPKPDAAAAATAAATPAPAEPVVDGDKVTIKPEEPTFAYDYKVTCLPCKLELSLANATIAKTVDAVKKTEDKAAVDAVLSLGDGPIFECSHCTGLKQLDTSPPQIAHKSTAHCATCELGIKNGLWLCLTCGQLGCAREQVGGSGGRGHAKAHNASSGHPLVVKLDTIKPDKAEVFCYACDAFVDNSKKLAEHLKTFGLILADQQSTGKTVQELLMEVNKNLDLHSLTDTSTNEPVDLAFGPGFTGLENLGNSCYMASVSQVLFALPSFYKRYYIDGKEHLKTCRSMRPGECYHCQLSKLGCGLNSGEYSKPPAAALKAATAAADSKDGKAAGSAAAATAAPTGAAGSMVIVKSDTAALAGDKRKGAQSGIRPRMFKKIVAAGHPDFLSGRQQDAIEYMQHFLQQLNQKERKPEDNPTTTFDFRIEDRTQCSSCKRVKYVTTKAAEVTLPIPVDEKALEKQTAQVKAAWEKAEAAKKQREKEKAEREKAQAAAAIAAVDAQIAKDVGATVAAVSGAPTPAPAADAAATAPASGANEKTPEKVVLPSVEFASCLAEWAKAEQIDYRCADCKKPTVATKGVKFETFPETLIVNMRRFVRGDWMPRKLDVDVNVPREIDLAEYLGKGMQSTEQAMSTAAAAPAAATVASDQIVADLEALGMGFSHNACVRAVTATKNAGVDAAMNWALEHGGDADINDSIKPAASAAPAAAAAAPAVDDAAVQQVLSILEGFDVRRIRHALSKTNGDVNRAVDYVMSHMDEPLPSDDAKAAGGAGAPKPTALELKSKYRLWAAITHLGVATSSGHYVAHILKDGKWCYFNDARVSVQDKPKLEQAYILLFRKI